MGGENPTLLNTQKLFVRNSLSKTLCQKLGKKLFVLAHLPSSFQVLCKLFSNSSFFQAASFKLLSLELLPISVYKLMSCIQHHKLMFSNKLDILWIPSGYSLDATGWRFSNIENVIGIRRSDATQTGLPNAKNQQDRIFRHLVSLAESERLKLDLS